MDDVQKQKEIDEFFADGKPCPECGHDKSHHGIDDDGWWYCDTNNWSCNCGNNIGR